MLYSCLCPIESAIVFASDIDVKSLGHSAFCSMELLHCLGWSLPTYCDGGCCPFHPRRFCVFFQGYLTWRKECYHSFLVHCLSQSGLTLTSRVLSELMISHSLRLVAPCLHFLLLYNKFLHVKQKGFHLCKTLL